MRLDSILAYKMLLAMFLLTGCGLRNDSTPAREQSTKGPTIASSQNKKPGAFVNVTERAGIRFTLNNGEAGDYMLVSTTPGGCAFLDYDQDGLQDIFLVQGGPAPGSPPGAPRPPCALYRNLGNGTFRDVSEEAGISKFDLGFAQAVAVGDYDNDGYPDLYITAYGGNHLLHNDGKGHFTDATQTAGVGDNDKGPRWATSAAWGDFDCDGKLDLIVLHYTKWSLATNRKCVNSKKQRTYCSPEVYEPNETPSLYRNEGNGRFRDVSKQMGLDKVFGRGLGVMWLDYDHDGWPDIYIACDITPNILLHNVGGKRFEDVGLKTGVAYGADAAVLSGMGITAGDYDNTGWESMLVTNFSGQPNSVYHATGGGHFEDVTYKSGIGSSSMNFLAFGVEFFDYDNDGLLDIVVGNGHVDPLIADIAPNTTYRERKLLYKNIGNGTFHDQVEDLGDLAEERVVRGLAVGDFDNDGRMDVLDNSQLMPAALYHNVAKGGHFVTLRLEGVKSNRDAAGALVWLTAGGRRNLAEVHDGSSYASTSDRRLHFGLGTSEKVEKLEIRWPSSAKQTFSGLAGDKFYLVREGNSPVVDPKVK